MGFKEVEVSVPRSKGRKGFSFFSVNRAFFDMPVNILCFGQLLMFSNSLDDRAVVVPNVMAAAVTFEMVDRTRDFVEV